MFKCFRNIDETINNLNENINNTKNEIFDMIASKSNGVCEKISEFEADNKENSSYLESKINIVNSIFPYLRYKNIEYLFMNFPSDSKKKVLLCGFYGAPNLGDEIMLQTILQKIPSDVDLTIMLSENLEYDITDFPPCNFIHYPKNMMDINDLAKYYDVIIFGGGAIIDDFDYIGQQYQMPLGYILVNLSKRAIKYKKDVILYGLSCNDAFSNMEYIKKLDFVINNCAYVSFRDTNSIKVLSKYMDVSKIVLVDDVIFANSLFLNKKFNISKENKSSKACVGMIMICSADNYELSIKIIKKLLKDKNVIISLIPFYSYFNNDYNYYKKICEEINDERLIISNIPKNLDEIVDILNAQDYVISMRYHGSLVSLLMNKNVLSIIYDKHRHYKNKMNYIYDYYGFEKNILNISTIKNSSIDKSIKKLFTSKIKQESYEKKFKIANDNLNDVIKKYVEGDKYE